MPIDRAVSRRTLLKVGAGAAAAAALAPLGATTAFAAPKAGNGNGRLVPADKVGTITFTQRDVPNRIGIAASAQLGQAPVMGYLGGDDPTDLNDLGPLVPLPGGWRELLEFLANAGFEQIEFAGYGQNAANPGGAAPNPAPGGVTTAASRAAYLAYGRTLRGFLDEFGLEAIGNHGFIPNTWPGPSSAGGAMSTNDYDRFQTELEFASILGMPYMGTGNDPTNATTMRNKEQWDVAAEKWTALNQLSLAWGIQLYPHNHSPAYNFLQDGPMVTVTQDRLTGAPIAPTVVRGESGRRMMEYFLEITNPDQQVIELDIFWAHVAQHQHRWYYDYNGNRVEKIFQPLEFVASQPIRFALYHAKDGDKIQPEQPPSQNGYVFVPFGHSTSDIDFETFFKEQGARGYHNPNYEQDNAPGSTQTPEGRGQSLRFSRFSAANLNALRG